MPYSNETQRNGRAERARPLIAVDRALGELRRGGVAVIRGNGAGVNLLVQAAEATTPHSLAQLTDLAGSMPLIAITQRRAAALKLPVSNGPVVALQVPDGMAAQEVREIADPLSTISFRMPPFASPPSDVERALAAAVELTKLARLLPAALAARITADGGDVERWLGDHDLVAVTVEDVAGYQANAARTLKPVSQARVPLAGAEDTRILAYRPSDGGIEHLAIVIGEPREPVLVRIHSECFTGDLLGSLRCDCGDQLRGAIQEIARAGAGVLIYLAQEGRGIGLVNKLRAYQLQDDGADTVEANEQLGFDADERVYMPAAEILKDLGFRRVRLMTNNPEKVTALARFGVEVTERVPHAFPSNPHNERYLQTKATKSGHLF
ncbi:MAG: GTP cyclohydrolase II [Gemmatimonas sp.]